MKRTHRLDIGIGIGLFALAAFILWESRDYLERAAQLPRIIAYTFVLLGLIMIVSAVLAIRAQGAGLADVDEDEAFEHVPWRQWVIVVIALIAFVFAMRRVGFYESCFVFIWLTTAVLSAGDPSTVRRHVRPPVFAFVMTGVLYLGFRVFLRVPTPRGMLLSQISWLP